MPPKKKAPARKATPKGRLKVSKKKSTIGTENKGKGIAANSIKKDDDAKDDAVLRFPQFPRFPAEIRQEIFTQALHKPSVHFMEVRRAVVPGYNNDDGDWVDSKWHLTYHPKTRGTDGSGYRVIKDIGAVNHEARQIMIRAMKNPGSLPFARAWGPMDADNDLVVFDFVAGAIQHEYSNFRYFHVDNQFFTPFFDPVASYPEGKSRVKDGKKKETRSIITDTPSGMADVKKVGVMYRQSADRRCGSHNTVFQCCIHAQGSVSPHADWNMCPDEVAGFIDSVPSLEEFYFVVHIPQNKKEEQERLQLYKKWFFTTYHEQLRIKGKAEKWLTMFHDADKTYIEVDRFLMLDSGETRRMDLDIVREVRLLVNEVHRQLLQDAPQIPKDNRRIFRTSYEKRQQMVYKILLPVSI